MVDAVLAAFLRSDRVLVLPLMVTYLGSNPCSTSTPSSRVGRSRTWPMVAFTSKPEPRYLPIVLALAGAGLPLAGAFDALGVLAGAAVLVGAFADRLDLVAMSTVCSLRS